MVDALEIARIVRNACVKAALNGYEQAQIAGLCQEGAWEVAVDTMRTLDLGAVVETVVKARNDSSSADGQSLE